MIESYFKSLNRNFTLLHGDCCELLRQFNFKFNCIFADPPYFLSNGGISVQNGQIVCVDKGDWDKGLTPQKVMEFNMEWIGLCREKLKDNGTIWVSGTYHNIFSVANCLTELGFKILNVVTWVKTNPPPNISCRYFTYSTEFIIWARKNEKKPHYFNYDLMKQLNDGKQMTDVWRLPAIAPWEKACGSSTTGIAANLLGRRFLGIDQEEEFLKISECRREELDDIQTFHKYRSKIRDISYVDLQCSHIANEETNCQYCDLPF